MTTSTEQSAAPVADPRLSDPRAEFERAVELLLETLAQVRPEHWELPTPCPEMDVAELGEHLVMVVRRIACAGRGEPLFQWPMSAPDVSVGEWIPAIEAARAEGRSVWTDAVLPRPTEVPWGTFPGGETLAVYVNELTVHTWDLARAIGVEPQWDQQVLDLATVAIHRQLPLADRAPIWAAAKAQMPPGVPWQDPFGNAVEVSADASPIERLVAWNGRTP